MKRVILISLSFVVVMILAMTAFAFAGEKVVISDSNVKIIEKKGAFLGIYMEELDRKAIRKLDYPKTRGVWIVDIVKDSPAEKAGLEIDDVIYKFDETKVKDQGHLLELIGDKDPGDVIDIVIYHDGKKKEYKLELGEKARKFYTVLNIDDEDVFFGDEIGKHIIRIDKCKDGLKIAERALAGMNGMKTLKVHCKDGTDNIIIRSSRVGPDWLCRDRPGLGIRIENLSDDMAGYFSMDNGEGVLVLEVLEDTPAEKAGMKSGDIIIRVEEENIADSGELMEFLEDIDEDAEEISVTVIRKGKNKVFRFDVDELRESGRTTLFFQPDMTEMKEIFKHFKVNTDDDRILFKTLKKNRPIEELEFEKLRDDMETLKKRLEKLEKKQD